MHAIFRGPGFDSKSIKLLSNPLQNKRKKHGTKKTTRSSPGTILIPPWHAQVVETSVTVNNNSPIQDYVHPDDQTQPTFEMTPGFKPFTEYCELEQEVH